MMLGSEVMLEIWQLLVDNIRRHPGKIAGTVLGLVLGWLIISYGVLRALFILACIALGFYIGSRFDDKDDYPQSERYRRRGGWSD
jgi:uncharacterized membrane protein